jgi:glycolate oxidase
VRQINLLSKAAKKPVRKPPAVPIHSLAQLQTWLGKEAVLLDLPQRLMYRYDGIAVGTTPLAVVLPESTLEVVETVKLARHLGVALVARGAASGLSGGAIPVQESIVVAFTRMTGLTLDPLSRTVLVEPGVVTAQISEQVKPHGLYYPPDPASLRTSTIGGNLAENAGGPMCFKKGVTGDYVEWLEYVDHQGRIHHLKRGAYDLPGLLVGSEGTLGFITKARLRLEPLPRFSRTLMAWFDEVGQAAEAVSAAIASGAVPSKLEFLDRGCVRAVEAYLHMGLPVDAEALLLVDTDGDDLRVVEEELEWVAEACQAHGGTVKMAADPAEAEALWKARRSVSPAIGRIRPKRLNEDIAVPRSALPQVVRQIAALGQQYGFPLVQFGHIGDGNLHPNVMFDPSTDDEARVWELLHDIARVALAHGGVLSGEHGIGSMKRDIMTEALDSETLAALWRVKRAFDPEGLLNPGKILPEMKD